MIRTRITPSLLASVGYSRIEGLDAEVFGGDGQARRGGRLLPWPAPLFGGLRVEREGGNDLLLTPAEGDSWKSETGSTFVLFVQADVRPDPTRWVVAQWKHNNVGGESLVLYMDHDSVVFATGPTPWGTGSWGPFPLSCVSGVRPLRKSDRWRFSGTLDSYWTPQMLLDGLKRARAGTLQAESELETTLAKAIEVMDGATPYADAGAASRAPTVKL